MWIELTCCDLIKAIEHAYEFRTTVWLSKQFAVCQQKSLGVIKDSLGADLLNINLANMPYLTIHIVLRLSLIPSIFAQID